MELKKLRIDKDRLDRIKETTGIFIRAIGPDGKRGSFDIVHLEKESLLLWLKSRGGDNPWAEDVVGLLMGHGHLHPPDNGVVRTK